MSSSTETEVKTAIPSWVEKPGGLYDISVARAELGVDDVSANQLSHFAYTLLQRDALDDDMHNTAMRLYWIAASEGHLPATRLLTASIKDWMGSAQISKMRLTYFEMVLMQWQGLLAMSPDAAGKVPEAPVGLSGHKIKKVMARQKAAQAMAEEFEDDPEAEPFASETTQSSVAASETATSHTLSEKRVSPLTRPDPAPKEMVIVTSIGDKQSRDGQALQNRYRHVIGKPLKLTGSLPKAGEIAQELASSWPWASRLGETIERNFRLRRAVGATGSGSIRPMLFVGPSGSGKTSLALGLSEMLGRKASLVPAAGSADGAGLGAVARSWSSARPSLPFIAAAENGCADPAIIIDEIDKSVSIDSRNGSVVGVLINMIDHLSSYHDTCLMADIDLSRMLFMATANSLEGLPKPLLQRFDIFIIDRPGAEHFDTIVHNMKTRKAEELGVIPEALPHFDGTEYQALYNFFIEDNRSLRDFSRIFDFMLSEALERERSQQPLPN